MKLRLTAFFSLAQAVQQDFKDCYSTLRRSGKDSLPWRIEKPRKPTDNTLYGLRYLTTTIDEAHLYRNQGARHLAAITLLQHTRLRLIMTATPLQTSTKVRGFKLMLHSYH